MIIATETKEKDEGNDITGTSVLTFENYYPVKLTDQTKGTASVSSSVESLDSRTEVNFSWDSATAIYPDLSQYTAQ